MESVSELKITCDHCKARYRLPDSLLQTGESPSSSENFLDLTRTQDPLFEILFQVDVLSEQGTLAALDLADAVLGILPAGVLGLGFGFGVGGKFFPESGYVLRRSFRNYRRQRKGLPLLCEEDVAEVEYHSDFRRG